MNAVNNAEVKASARVLKVPPRKLGLVANLIKGMVVSDASKHLSFLPKRLVALKVKKCLESAVANAQNNYGIDIDTLFVKEISVGRSLVLKRMMPRGRGKASGIAKRFSNLYITLGQKEG